VAVVASQRVAGDGNRADRDRRALTRGKDGRVNGERSQRKPACGTGGIGIGGQQPVTGLKEVDRRLGLDHDLLDPLHAARTDVAGHHHPDRRPVHLRQRLAVHGIGKQNLAAERLDQRNRGAERLRRRCLPADIRSLERHMRRAVAYASGGEHVR